MVVGADMRFRGKEKRVRCAQGMISYCTIWIIWLLGIILCGYCIYIIQHIPEQQQQKSTGC